MKYCHAAIFPEEVTQVAMGPPILLESIQVGERSKETKPCSERKKKKKRFATVAGCQCVWLKHAAHLAWILHIAKLCAIRTKTKILKMQVQDRKNQFEKEGHMPKKFLWQILFWSGQSAKGEYNLKNLVQLILTCCPLATVFARKCLYFFLISPLSFSP